MEFLSGMGFGRCLSVNEKVRALLKTACAACKRLKKITIILATFAIIISATYENVV